MSRSRAPMLTMLTFLLAGSVVAENKAAAEDAPPEKPGETKGAEASGAEATEPTPFYVHGWMRLPTIDGSRLNGIGNLKVEPRKGEMTVVVFLASWCEPCQRIIEDLLEIEKKYTRLYTRFVFVFAHDTREDAEGFMKEYGMSGGVLANEAIYKDYHNPPLPTIYVGDRRTWMSHRFINAKPGDVARLEEVLKYLTAF